MNPLAALAMVFAVASLALAVCAVVVVTRRHAEPPSCAALPPGSLVAVAVDVRSLQLGQLTRN